MKRTTRTMSVGLTTTAVLALLLAGCSSTASDSNSELQRDAAPASTPLPVPTTQDELNAFLQQSKLECQSGSEKWTKPAGAGVGTGATTDSLGQWPTDKSALQGLRALGIAIGPDSKVFNAAGELTTATVPMKDDAPRCTIDGSPVTFILATPSKKRLLHHTDTQNCVADEAASRSYLVLRPCAEWFGGGAMKDVRSSYPLSYPVVESTAKSQIKMGGKCLTDAKLFARLLDCTGDGGPQRAELATINGPSPGWNREGVRAGGSLEACLEAPQNLGKSLGFTRMCDANPRLAFDLYDWSAAGPTVAEAGCPPVTSPIACSRTAVSVYGSSSEPRAAMTQAQLWNLPVRLAVANASGSPIGVSSSEGFDVDKVTSAKVGSQSVGASLMAPVKTQLLALDQSTVDSGTSPAFARLVSSGQNVKVEDSVMNLRLSTTSGDSAAAEQCSQEGAFKPDMSGAECGFIDVQVKVPGGIVGTKSVSGIEWGCRVGGVAETGDDYAQRFVALSLEKQEGTDPKSLTAGGFLPLRITVYDGNSKPKSLKGCDFADVDEGFISVKPLKFK